MTGSWELGLLDHVRSFWQYKWIVLASAFAIAGLTFAWRASTPDEYEAEARIFITVASEQGVSLIEDEATYAARIYAEKAELPTVLALALERSGVELTTTVAGKRVEVQRGSPPGFLDIVGSGPSATEAALLANGMAQALVETVADDLASVAPGSGEQTRIVAEVVEAATAPSDPVGPAPVRESLAAAVVAIIVIGEGVALWRTLRGHLPLTRPEQRVTQLTGLPCVRIHGGAEDRSELSLFAAQSLAGSPMVAVVQCQGPPAVVGAVRLAESAAVGGRRVLVIDGDAPVGFLHRQVGLPKRPGLADVLEGTWQLTDAVVASRAEYGTWLLTAGGSDGNGAVDDPSRHRWAGLLGPGDNFDLIVVSLTSASIPDGAARVLAELQSQTVLVLDPVLTTRSQLRELTHRFGGGGQLAGIMLVSSEVAAGETLKLSRRWRDPRPAQLVRQDEPEQVTTLLKHSSIPRVS